MAAVALCAACMGPDAGDGGQLVAVVAPQDRDTVRFEAAATARRCVGRGELVLEGIARGSGVLVLLRAGDSLAAGEYPFLARGDTISPRGALVSARFLKGDMAHGLLLDSGAVTVALRDGRLAAHVRGTGLETMGSLRGGVDARFEDVAPPRAADTVACRVEP